MKKINKKNEFSVLLDEFKKSIKEEKLTDNYCVIVYGSRGIDLNTNKHIRYVYKNIEEFEKKGESDFNKIPSEFGVAVQIWIFD